MEISKELLSEVYNFDIEDIRLLGTDNVTYEVRFNGLKNGLKYNIVNIYELAHKCKEWAFNNGYYLTIYNDAIDIILQSNCKIIANITNDSFIYDVKLVFKACEYILKEIKKWQQIKYYAV